MIGGLFSELQVPAFDQVHIRQTSSRHSGFIPKGLEAWSPNLRLDMLQSRENLTIECHHLRFDGFNDAMSLAQTGNRRYNIDSELVWHL